MKNKFLIQLLFIPGAMGMVCSCESQSKQYASPPGYDFQKPVRYAMPKVLHEISGIDFNKGNPDTLYAEQDEEGKVFHFKLGDTDIASTRFGKKGDFEDITICRDFVIMLRSDGTLFTFPLAETTKKEAAGVKIFPGLLEQGEFEGLTSIESTGKIFVLCKHCSNEKTSRKGYGYILQLQPTGDLVNAGNFEYKIKEIEAMAGIDKIKFHPSALVQHPVSRDWFILSSVNHLLVVTDEFWSVKAVYPLNPVLFAQPEGIAFDRDLNLYISNERAQTPAGTVLRFDLRKQ